jgi:hypothetical protein
LNVNESQTKENFTTSVPPYTLFLLLLWMTKKLTTTPEMFRVRNAQFQSDVRQIQCYIKNTRTLLPYPWMDVFLPTDLKKDNRTYLDSVINVELNISPNTVQFRNGSN